MASKLAPLPSSAMPWVDSQGRPTIDFAQFMRAVSVGNVGPFVTAANDAAAAKAGIPINGLYENNGVLQVRKT